MSTEKLRTFIDRLRDWLSGRALQALGGERAEQVETWRGELAQAERMLERKDDLPIAFLGPSQQGKSSLINALLGESVLAVGGAVGACTCVITSLHYRDAPGFRADVSFISLDDWRRELEAMKEDLESPPTDQDSAEDVEEREAACRAARQKLTAVYRLEDHAAALKHALGDARLGLPDDVLDAMTSGTPIVLEEEKALTLRNKVRRYLVGREQHEDGQFWPLITRVQIHGKFDVLANGVVLVDLPGLNDPNPARERVTKRYLDQARHIWLVCNSQTGIDRVFSDMLRDNGLFLRMFIEGRLDAFAVIATKIDDINLEAVLSQMGVEIDDFDGDYLQPLEFRRTEVVRHIRGHLDGIAREIVSRADGADRHPAFLERVRAIPVFAVSTSAYLHAVGRMSLYQGLKLTPEDTHMPRIREYLQSVSLEESHAAQVDACRSRLGLLHQRIQGFFFDRIQRAEREGIEAREEWRRFSKVAQETAGRGRAELDRLQARCEESLAQHRGAFEEELEALDRRAVAALGGVCRTWDGLHWRSLQAAVKRNGEWFSRATGRDINLSRDVARAYLDLLPFIWDDFFGSRLLGTTRDLAGGADKALEEVAHQIQGAVRVLRHQSAGVDSSIEQVVETARESFDLQSGEITAALVAQIQRTRQSLSSGIVATAADVMRPAFAKAADAPGGPGVKRRMLDSLQQHAKSHAPALYVTIRQELMEGVATLLSSMKPQLASMVTYGHEGIERLHRNLLDEDPVTPEVRVMLTAALSTMPEAGSLSCER